MRTTFLSKKDARNLPFFLWPLILVWAVRDAPFFWDTVQLGSKHAHFFYENGLKWAALPTHIDSGHPPFLGYYLASCWAFFGKTLLVSHLAMLPFLLGIVFLLLRSAQRIGGGKWMYWLLPLVLLDPVVAGQMALISPDTCLLFFFLWAIEGFYEKKRLWQVLGIVGLCAVSMRGMMVVGAIGAWQVLSIIYGNFTMKNKWASSFGLGKAATKQNIATLLVFFPGFLLATLFLIWHKNETGWIGFHASSSWSPAFEKVDARGFVKNMAVLGWRWLDFGRLFEWLALALMVRKIGRGTEFKISPTTCLFLILCLFLCPSALVYHNLSSHRYFLPLFLVFHWIVFQAIIDADWTDLRKKTVLVLLILGFASGNLWHYPIGVSMDWDATLAHLPYFKARRDMIRFIDGQHLDFQEIGTSFPNYNSQENLELNGDPRSFSEKDFDKNEYILWSNVLNDFDKKEYDELEKNWTRLHTVAQSGISFKLYQKGKAKALEK